MTNRSMTLALASLATLLALFAPAPVARADIFEWEYVNPANPGEGKQPSTTLVPDGAGTSASPGAILSKRNLTMAYLIGANLTGATASAVNLTNADLSQANLFDANFSGYSDEYGTYYTDLTGAIFTNAEVRGAQFAYSGIATSQLYSTASYQAHDLSRIGLGFNDLAGVNLANQNLADANFMLATLADANLSQANLTNAGFWYATLIGANFTGADVRGASFPRTYLDFPYDNYLGGITLAQLYSTASYQAHDLTGIDLRGNGDFAGANFAGQNLTRARFGEHFGAVVNLTGANLSQANLSNASISEATLDNADLSQANLTHANLYGSTLSGANLTGAEVRGAYFPWDITAAQLYSTASYLAHDLTGIILFNIDLTGGNLAGQNLTNARFEGATLTNADLSHANLSNASFANLGFGASAANLIGANLSQANLTNAHFNGFEDCDEFTCYTFPGANLTGANLSGADARGANFYLATVDPADSSNLIWDNGHIYGLDLTSSEALTVRNYHGAAAPVVVIEQHLTMDATGTLRLVFDADAWDSTISFAAGIPVALGGTLELGFAPGVDVATQSGRTIDLFDWTGVTSTGAFTISSPYTWNLTNLYTTGEVTLAAVPGVVPGDFNHDGTVDAADYVVWRKNPGGIYTPNDYNIWRAHFGETRIGGAVLELSLNAIVPEPPLAVLLVAAAAVTSFITARRRKTRFARRK